MWRCNRTTLLIYLCAAFLAGLVLGRFVAVPFLLCVPLLAAGVVALVKRNVQAVVLVIVAGLALGTWRGHAFYNQLSPYRDYAMQKVTVAGTSSVDAVYGINSQITFTIKHVTIDGHSVPGTMKLSGFGATMVYSGDRVTTAGKLYPTRGSNQASISYGEITVTSRGHSWIDSFRRKFVAGMQSALPEPLASFGLGLLVGQRNTLPPDLTQALLMVGLTHIIAVSGYNLTILLNASKRLLGERSKVLSTALSLVLIFGFLAVAGTSASIVRAAVISILSLAAWYYGRTVRPLLLILLASAGTAFVLPTYVWGDISWYLSFLAFFGILMIAPLVTQAIFGEKEPRLVPQIIIESLTAELMTLPLILYIFGQLSLVSLLANVLVCALIPLAMLLGFVAGLAGMWAGVVSGWFAWPAKLLLGYMVDIVNLLASIPHVFQSNRFISWVDMAAVYAAVAALLLFAYWRRTHRAWFTDVEVVEYPHERTQQMVND